MSMPVSRTRVAVLALLNAIALVPAVVAAMNYLPQRLPGHFALCVVIPVLGAAVTTILWRLRPRVAAVAQIIQVAPVVGQFLSDRYELQVTPGTWSNVFDWRVGMGLTFVIAPSLLLAFAVLSVRSAVRRDVARHTRPEMRT